MKKSPGIGFPSLETEKQASIIRGILLSAEYEKIDGGKGIQNICLELFKTSEDLSKFINVHSLLHWSVYTGKIEVINFFLSIDGVCIDESFGDMRIANINFYDRPLHIACRGGNVEICKLLIKNGAKVDIVNRFLKLPEDVSSSENVTNFFISYNQERINRISLSISSKLISSKVIRFGVITDLHYGEIPSLVTHKGEFRMYSLGKKKLKTALKVFNNLKVEFGVCLGDLVDIQAFQRNEKMLSEVGEIFSNDNSNKFPFFFAQGNHDKYNLNTADFLKSLRFSPEEFSQHENAIGKEEESLYYFYDYKFVRLIFLDAFDLSCITHDNEKSILAYNILRKKNPNFDPNGPFFPPKKGNEEEEEGENQEKKKQDEFNERFVYYTGGIGKKQIDWMKNIALNKKSLQENNISVVIVCCHLGVLPGIPDLCSSGAVLWNYKEVQEILREISIEKNKKMYYLFGHYHKGGKRMVVDEDGIHHYCFPGAISSDVSSSFSVCEILETGELNIFRE